MASTKFLHKFVRNLHIFVRILQNKTIQIPPICRNPTNGPINAGIMATNGLQMHMPYKTHLQMATKTLQMATNTLQMREYYPGCPCTCSRARFTHFRLQICSESTNALSDVEPPKRLQKK